MSRRPVFPTTIIGKSGLLREGIARILGSATFRIVASISSADDMPGRVQADHPLFVIVQTGDDFDFVAEQIELVKDSHPSSRIAVVADRFRPNELVSAFRLGANGCFVDVMTCDVFVRSLELVVMGETVLPPAFLSCIFAPDDAQLDSDNQTESADKTVLATEVDDPAPQLSPREKLILRCLIDGDSNKSIARKMDIAEATVKVHVKAILRKIRVHNRTQAAIWGMNNGCLAGPIGAIPPPLSPGMAKRLQNPMASNSQIERIGDPVCSTAIEQPNHAEVARIEGFVHKDVSLRAEAAGRLRKH